MSRIPRETLALGLDGHFLAPTLRVCRSRRELRLACGHLEEAWEPSPRSPVLVIATGPPSQRAVFVSGVERRGDLVTVRYCLAPRARLPRELLLAAEERFAVGLSDPGLSSPYHLVQLHGLSANLSFRFERELERSVMGWIELRDGQVTLDEDPMFAPIGDPDRLRIRHGAFEGEIPADWTADTPGVPLALIAPPPRGRSRFTIPDARAASSLARLRGLLLRVEGVVRRARGPELLPQRAWLIETGDQVYGQEPSAIPLAG